MQKPPMTLCLLVAFTSGCPGDDSGSTSDGDSTSGDSSSGSAVTIDPPGTSGVDSSGTSGGSTDSTSAADTSSGSTSSMETTGDGSTSTGGDCAAGEVLCDGACIDPLMDPDYCGASDDCLDANAGVVCGMGNACVDGMCDCAGGIACGGGCIDPMTDPDYCGATADCMGANAGETCTLSAECQSGVCVDTCENCSFETGDFTGWTTTDIAMPYLALAVDPGGYFDPAFMFFTTTPTDGSFCAVTGFDGAGPGTVELGQDLTLAASPPANLEFDYRAGWELAMFGATLDRSLNVTIEPAGGGVPMDTVNILTAPAGNYTADSGALTGVVDLSAYAGQTVFVRFVFDIPENFSGPALAQLDNVRVVAQ